MTRSIRDCDVTWFVLTDDHLVKSPCRAPILGMRDLQPGTRALHPNPSKAIRFDSHDDVVPEPANNKATLLGAVTFKAVRDKASK